MTGVSFRSPGAVRWLAGLMVLWGSVVSRSAWSQTPSPLQEWQYSGGVPLEKLFAPDQIPDWRVVTGLAAEHQPLYDGSQAYRVVGGPVINVRYRDIAFASTGEGLGVNIIHGTNYRAGLAVGYDLGRHVEDDIAHLHGLGDISPAAVVKAFASYVVSKDFPLVLRADVRQVVGGADGLVGDLAAYMPLPGSSEKLFMFAGPSVTVANHPYLQKEFGVTPAQSLASGYRIDDAHGGAEAAGFGFSATRFVGSHWLCNANLAVDRLLGSAVSSPITRRSTQHVLALSASYNW